MGYVNIEIWDASGNKKTPIEVPSDIAVNRIIGLLVERLNFPRFDGTMGHLLSYKLHHQASKKQLLDDQNMEEAGVRDGDILRLIPEITAG